MVDSGTITRYCLVDFVSPPTGQAAAPADQSRSHEAAGESEALMFRVCFTASFKEADIYCRGSGPTRVTLKAG